jgi:streptogramin lyase
MRTISVMRVGLVLSLSLLVPGLPWADQTAPVRYEVLATIQRGGYALAFGYDSLWMMSDGQLARVNPIDNSVIDIPVPAGESGNILSDIDRYRGIAIGEGAVWIPDVGNSVIHKVDPKTNKVVLTIPTFVFGSAGNIGAGAGSLWVITFDDHDKSITRYDPDTGAEQARIALPSAGRAVAVDFGKVWVAAASKAELYVIDPAANRVTSTVAIHAPSHLLTSGFGAIWVGYDAEGLVEEIDGGLEQSVQVIKTSTKDMESDGDITVGGGYVWMINRGSIIAQIDPKQEVARATMQPPVGTLAGRRIRYGQTRQPDLERPAKPVPAPTH